jgi:predicted ATPase
MFGMVDRVHSITVENYTSIRRTAIDVRDLNVLVGANGAGKSNFIRALELLGRIVDADLGLFVGQAGGASALLNRASMDRQIKLTLDAPPNGYQAILTPASSDELVFADERIRMQYQGYDAPYDRSIGRGHRETRLHEEVRTHSPSSIAGHVMEMLHGCRVYHFHDTSRLSPVKQFVPTADNLTLRSDAGNLAAILFAMRDSDDPADAAAYRRIIGAIRQVAPFFREFVLQPERSDRIRLRWREQGTDVVFSADQMSDGTLRFVCLATLLLSPRLPKLVILDEPELGQHPYAIVQLADLLRQASTRAQVLFATQSVTLMNQFELDDLVVVERADGGTTLYRPDAGKLADWLAEYTLGELWEKNLIGGRPGSARTGLA